jgi:hypothetical protein
MPWYDSHKRGEIEFQPTTFSIYNKATGQIMYVHCFRGSSALY